MVGDSGDGKGEASAAVGGLGGGWARGVRVGVVQLMKSGRWNAGERKLAGHLGIDWWTL